MFWFFDCEACGILALWTGIEPAPTALGGEVLTTGPPGKSLHEYLILFNSSNIYWTYWMLIIVLCLMFQILKKDSALKGLYLVENFCK